MAPRSGAANALSSPSFIDNEAASQQLLAEASSPVRRPTAAPTAAQRGASLLNAARALPKRGQLKPPKLLKLGKLPRASLSSLVSEGSQKKARGKQMYDIDPSPQKKRSSLPAQIFALNDQGEDVVSETSQVQPDDDAPAEIPEGLDVSAPKDALFGDDDIVDAPTSPVAGLEEEVLSATKKRRGRSRKSGDSVRSYPSDAGAAGLQETVKGPSSAESQKRRGWPRKSGEGTASRQSVGDIAEVEEEIQGDAQEELEEPAERPVVTVKPKRKARPERDTDMIANDDPSNTIRPTKRAKKIKGPKMISPDVLEFEDDVMPPIATSRRDARHKVQTDTRQDSREVRRQERRQDAQPRGDPQPIVKIPIRTTRPRTAQLDAAPSSATQQQSATDEPTAAIERKGNAAQRIARNTRAAMTTSAPEPAKGKRTSRRTQETGEHLTQAAEADGEDDEDAAQAPSGPNGNSRTKGNRRDASGDVGNDAGAEANGQDDEVEADDGYQGNGHDDGEVQDDERRNRQDEDAEAADEQEGDGADAEGAEFPALDTVFNFAAAEERTGVCSMGLARKIHRRCDRAHLALTRDECSLDDLAACKDDVVRLLKSIGTNIQAESRASFKRDAFAYLFRALAVVFEAMYDTLHEQEGNAIGSYQAMQIMHPFVHEILRFKDTMDAWKVKVQQHTPGDRLIKGVETGLIAPLRVVEKEMRRRLKALQGAEQDRQARIEIQRQQKKQEQMLIRKEEALRSVRERRKRWQDLHIARMQYEPDPSRRRRLRFVEPPDAVETDANGNQFERVPFFGQRSAPPPSSVATTSVKEWTQEQETVLLDALQSSASLEHIFREHCRPGNALRDLSVSDFADKLAWVRSAWAQLSQQYGWELPEWVEKIPVLP